MRNVPIAPRYLQALFMDVGYDFELGGVAPRNGLHRLVLLSGAGGETRDGLPARLPSSDTASRIRRQRYQNLAYHIAEFDRVFAESPDDRTRLPLAVAESWIARLELSPAPYTLRCERTDSPRWTIEEETFDAAGRAETAPDESASFDIHLVWSATEGRYGGFRAHPNNLTAKAIGSTPE